MIRFSLADLMIVVTGVAFAASAVALPRESERTAATLTSVLLGVTISGPPLLLLRCRRGNLVGQWGLGELAWFFLGLYFLPPILWSIANPLHRARSERWLAWGFVMAASIGLSAVIIYAMRLMVRLMGRPVHSGRPWFVGRGTNQAGLIVVLLHTVVVGFVRWWAG